MNKRTIQSRVRRGAKLLDKNFPGWARRIRLKRLDMTRGYFEADDKEDCGCIAAQLDAHVRSVAPAGVGMYSAGAERFFGVTPWDSTAVNVGIYADRDDEYPVLDAAWKKEVRARR